MSSVRSNTDVWRSHSRGNRQILCARDELPHSDHPRGLSTHKGPNDFLFSTQQNRTKQRKQNNKNKNPQNLPRTPPTSHHSWYLKSQKSMENQQTSISVLPQLLSLSSCVFLCLFFFWVVCAVLLGRRTGCGLQSQGSPAGSLER